MDNLSYFQLNSNPIDESDSDSDSGEESEEEKEGGPAAYRDYSSLKQLLQDLWEVSTDRHCPVEIVSMPSNMCLPILFVAEAATESAERLRYCWLASVTAARGAARFKALH